MNRPMIAIPMGDPAGIGPEIVCRAIADKSTQDASRCIVVGDENILRQADQICKTGLRIQTVCRPEDGQYEPGVLNLIDLKNVNMELFRFGEINGMCGKAAYEYIESSIQLALAAEVDAVATTPINKEALKAGNVDFIGHTEIFGALTKTEDPLTMFEVAGMRVFFLSRHVSLKKACEMVKKERIIDYVIRCQQVLKQLGVTEGVMAVAGLNPHCGEHGLFGEEEVTEIMPAIEELQKMGYHVAGPIGADSVFHQALQGRYNSVLSLYHDQGHIATKTYDFDRTIAVTGGMPILRTSVDHGTAFDIAGKGIASAVSMIEAISLAAKYSESYKNRLS